MDLDQLVRRKAGRFMQPIHVLRYETLQLSASRKSVERRVCRIRLSFLEKTHHFKALFPVLEPLFFRRNKILVLNRPMVRPYPTRGPEIRYARFSRNSSAGQRHDAEAFILENLCHKVSSFGKADDKCHEPAGTC